MTYQSFEDTGVDRVELTNASQVEVGDGGIEYVLKVDLSGLTSI